VKYVNNTPAKELTEVRLIYLESIEPVEVMNCDAIKFPSADVFKTSTRSMEKKKHKELKEQVAKGKLKFVKEHEKQEGEAKKDKKVKEKDQPRGK
jgi:hypothetical protein